MIRKIILTLLFSFSSMFAFEHLDPNNIEEKLKDKNAIVDFYATWCPPCRIISKNLIDFEKVKPEGVVIYKVDIDQHMDLAKKYNVRSLPTLVYFKNGEVVAKDVGIKDVDELLKTSVDYFK